MDNQKPEYVSSMLFAPQPKKKKRLQLAISERRLLLMMGDALAVIVAVVIALRIWAIVAEIRFSMDFVAPEIGWFFAMTTLWFLVASANDFYNLALAANRVESLQRLMMITFQLLVVYLIIFFLAEPGSLPRLFIFYYGFSSFVLVAIWRLLNPALIGWASAPRRALIIGTDWAAETIINTLQHEPGSSYQLVGLVGDADSVGQNISDVPVMGTGGDILQIVISEDIRELIITSTRELAGDVFQGVMDAYEYGVAITPMPIAYERVTERVPVEHIDGSWAVVLPIQGSDVLNPYPFLKRLMDVSLSLIGMVVFILLLPFIAIAIYIDSPGPIFFVQTRVGIHGRLFRIIKFRTMIPDAEKYTGAVFAETNDPRITRMGRILRKTRLDELPQLINVLKNDMSLIGPRPERPEHVQRLQAKIPFYRTRHIVKPGVTGWAQVRYKYGANDEDALIKLQYDLYYIRHQSIPLDVNILIRTVGKALSLEGQ